MRVRHRPQAGRSVAHHAVGRRAARRAVAGRAGRIASRIGRLSSADFPAGSCSCQSRWRLPGWTEQASPQPVGRRGGRRRTGSWACSVAAPHHGAACSRRVPVADARTSGRGYPVRSERMAAALPRIRRRPSGPRPNAAWSSPTLTSCCRSCSRSPAGPQGVGHHPRVDGPEIAGEHIGRPGVPQDGSPPSRRCSASEGEWRHLEHILDPLLLQAELNSVRVEYDTIRLRRPSATSP